MTTLIYVSSSHGDWCGIYLDGLMHTEGHSIPVHDWMDLLQNHDVQQTEQYEVDGEYLEFGGLPEAFTDIPKDKLQ